MDNFLKKYYKTIVVLILAAVFIVSLIVSSQEATTMDEQAHIPSAYTYVKYADMRLNPEHPPLIKYLSGIPLVFMDVKFPADDLEWQTGINEQWTLGNKFIHSNNADAITFWSRFPIIIIALILGIFIFQWTRELAGTAAGLFALALYAFDPNILGHNHYVTTDLGIAAFIFFAFYFFVKFLKKPDFKNTVLAGLFLGLAELTKFSAVLLFPIFGLILVTYALARKKPETEVISAFRYKWKHLWIYVRKFIIALIVCFGAIYAVYFITTFRMPEGKVADVAKTVLSDEGKGGVTKSIIAKMDQSDVLRPMSEYVLGVAMVFVRVTGGNTYYFFGEVDNQARMSYFPAVFILKETLPMLFLIIFSLICAIINALKSVSEKSGNYLKRITVSIGLYLRTGVSQYSMLAFIALYSYLSVTGNLNIGFRHLFPIMALLYVLVAKKIFDFHKNLPETSRKTFNIILAAFIIWIVLIPIISFPSYISYFNELVGGPKNGYKYVVDSNLDWGQDLKRLSKWINEYNSCAQRPGRKALCKSIPEEITRQENGIQKIRVDYFGGSSPQYYLKDKYVPWHASLDPEPGWYAISAEFLQESIYKKKNPGENDYSWTKNYSPIRIGNSIFVFYIP